MQKHQAYSPMLFLIAERYRILIVIFGDTYIPPIISICLDIIVIQDIRFYCIGKNVGMVNGLVLVDFVSFVGFQSIL